MLNQFNNNFQDKPFHSHGYASAANGEGIGAVSSETYSQRQQVHRNRQHVRGYNESHLANGNYREASLKANVTQSNELDQADGLINRRSFSREVRSQTSQQRSVAPAPRQPRFTEPRHRYNPYQ
jgi:hypothetical protein